MDREFLKALFRIQDAGYDVQAVECPNCGKRELDYLFEEISKNGAGCVSVWCNACNYGIFQGVHIADASSLSNNVNIIRYNDPKSKAQKLVPRFIPAQTIKK